MLTRTKRTGKKYITQMCPRNYEQYKSHIKAILILLPHHGDDQLMPLQSVYKWA